MGVSDILGGVSAGASLLGGGKQSAQQSQQQNLEQQQLQQTQGLINNAEGNFNNNVAPGLESTLSGPISSLLNFNDTTALQNAGQGDVETLLSRIGGAANPAQLAQSLLNTNEQNAMNASAGQREGALQSGIGDTLSTYGQLNAPLTSLGTAAGASNQTAGAFGSNAASYGNPWGSAITGAAGDIAGIGSSGAGKGGASTLSGNALPNMNSGTVGPVAQPTTTYQPLAANQTNNSAGGPYGGAVSPFGNIGAQTA